MMPVKKTVIPIISGGIILLISIGLVIYMRIILVLLSSLSTDSSTIYFNQPDADRFRSGFPWDNFVSFARLNGYPDNELQAIRQSHPGFKFRPKGNLDFCILRESDTIRISDYVFHGVETPGHTKGICVSMIPTKNSFVAGDHIQSLVFSADFTVVKADN
jgi:hypothetical protein